MTTSPRYLAQNGPSLGVKWSLVDFLKFLVKIGLSDAIYIYYKNVGNK